MTNDNWHYTKCSHGHDSGVFICIKDLADRVDKIEQKTVQRLSERIAYLEGRASKHDDDIHRLQDQMKYYHNLELEAPTDMDIWNKIKALEEWKRATETLDYGNYVAWQRTALTGGWKAVDKQVWEDIKYRIGQIHERSRKYNGFPSYDFAMLKEAIKKVDPEWEPSK